MIPLLNPCRVSTSPTAKGHTIGHERTPCRTRGKKNSHSVFDGLLSREKKKSIISSVTPYFLYHKYLLSCLKDQQQFQELLHGPGKW